MAALEDLEKQIYIYINASLMDKENTSNKWKDKKEHTPAQQVAVMAWVYNQ